ncbi:MAG: TatD family hydrolase [Bacteroidales bacterium]|nr:TatD family hydrolase [Bacteroidales bacterium]
MNFIDIHTHSYYQDPEVTLLLNTFPEETDKTDLPVLLSMGLHPWHINENHWEDLVETIRQSASTNPRVAAIGETGLDKTIACPASVQEKVFLSQLRVAETFRKPVVIHCVRSYSEMLALRKKSDQQIPWIFHWFNADEQIARELIRKNCYLSFGHMLFSNKSKAFRVFKTIPPETVFFETDDAGYTIRQVYEQAALLRNMQVTDLKKKIIDNFTRCFQR